MTQNLEYEELIKNLEILELSPEVKADVAANKWSAFADRINFAVSNEAIAQKLKVLCWKRLGGKVMNSSYSAAFHNLDKTWDVNRHRCQIAYEMDKRKRPAKKANIEAYILSAALKLADNPELLGYADSHDSGSFKQYVYNSPYSTTLSNIKGLKSPLRKLVAILWALMGGKEGHIPDVTRHLDQYTDFDVKAYITAIRPQVKALHAKVVMDDYGNKIVVDPYARMTEHIWAEFGKSFERSIIRSNTAQSKSTGPKTFIKLKEYTPLDPTLLKAAEFPQIRVHRGNLLDVDMTKAEIDEVKRLLLHGEVSWKPIEDNPLSPEDWRNQYFSWYTPTGRTPQKYTPPFHELPKEKTMKAYETINLVYGQDITTCTTEQLIAYIKKAEGERNALDGVKAPSKKIKAMQADFDAAIAKMVEALDAKA